ncbi:MAG: hypothetical protein PHH28_09125 [Desulfuromonadaceae bacterium]|nr:hypothetical protein [Desulfuromonadaceae bacterium]
MATTILVLLSVLLTMAILPWLGSMGHTDLHHTDLMAGDEGED